jgi:hypothetical protein
LIRKVTNLSHTHPTRVAQPSEFWVTASRRTIAAADGRRPSLKFVGLAR